MWLFNSRDGDQNLNALNLNASMVLVVIALAKKMTR
jgi:hypothetical protein